MNKNLGLTFLVASVLLGCAAPSAQPILPDGVPFARLKSTLRSGSSRRESLRVFIADGECGVKGNSMLFSVKGTDSKPEGFVKVPSGKPLRIDYDEEASGGRNCKISLYVTLENDKDYALVGGADSKPGLIPILTDTRICSFGIRNEITSALIASQATCTTK